MIILYQKKFLKDLSRIPSPFRKKIEDFVFNELPLLKFNEIESVEKMTGYSRYYKIRFGDYRMGLYFEKDTLSLERVLHRKEIYRFFP